MDIGAVLKEIRASMKARELYFIWVSSPENHRYTTGFGNPDGRVLIGLSEVLMFADFRYFEEAQRSVPDCITVIQPSGRLISGELADRLSGFGKLRIGYEEARLVCAEYDALSSALPNAELVAAGEVLAEPRRIKQSSELEKIKQAQKITDDAFSHILTVLSPDMTELDVAAELEYFMKRAGAEDKSFETIAVSGKNSSSPHKTPENRKLERGFLTMDFGAVVEGYRSDMTRTVVLGCADDEMRRLYGTVLEAQRAVLDVIGVGKRNCEMDRIARDIIDGAGYAGAFGHSLGHGVGLEIHEAPNLSQRDDGQILKAGNVVTVEPGIYVAGRFGCRIEDMVIITEDGAEDITTSPKELIELW